MKKFPSNVQYKTGDLVYMSLSAHELKDEFKSHLDQLVGWASHKQNLREALQKVKTWKEETDHVIQKKLKLLERGFNEQALTGDYLHSVTKGFDTIDHLLNNEKILLDFTHLENVEDLLGQIKAHYVKTLIPLLNILAELENDYIGLTHQTIHHKQEVLAKMNTELQKLKAEETQLKNKFFVIKKKDKLQKLSSHIKMQELKRKITKLTLHHDKLNLYYFNNNEPPELKELKQKADALRHQLMKMTETVYG